MSLQNLLALQKKKAEANATRSAKPLGQKNDAVKDESKPAATVHSAQQSSAAPKADSESAKVDASPPKPKGLGLNLAGAKTPAKSPIKTVAPPNPSKPLDPDSFSLEDIATLEAGSIAEPEPEVTTSEFIDEIEATAPDRPLDPSLTDEQKAFVDSLDGIYQVLHDPDMFGQAVRIVMMELQENPEYARLVVDDDVHVMIRGMRRVMGLARVKKQEKKRGGATNKASRKKAGVSDDAMALLDSLMGSGSDD